MRRGWLLACLALGWAALAAAEDKAKPEGCGDHGTAVVFEAAPKAAARKAAEQKKLVMVLHVSGHFEDPQFT